MDKLAELADICKRNDEEQFCEFWKQLDFLNGLGLNPKHFDINASVIIERGSAEIRNVIRTTCLGLAGEFGSSHFVNELLRRGAEKDIVDSNGNTPLHNACLSKVDPTNKVRVLQVNDYALMNKTNKSGNTPIHFASVNKDASVLSQLITNPYVDVNALSYLANSVLHVPASFNILSSMYTLLSRRNIKINVKNRDGFTPMDNAAIHGNFEVFALLRSRDEFRTSDLYQNGNTVNYLLCKALIKACIADSEEKVKFLVEDCGASCSLDGGDTTAFHAACESRQEAYLKVTFLLPRCLSLLTEAREGCESLPIHLASANPDSRVLTCILPECRFVDINARRKDGKTALHMACASGIEENVKILLSISDIDVNTVDSDENTPLHIACLNGVLSIIVLLKRHPICRLDLKNRCDKTPDQLTPYKVRILELVQQGDFYELTQNVNETESFGFDQNGNWPLHIVCSTDKDAQRKAKFFIQNDPTQIYEHNKDGFLPIHLAIIHDNRPVALELVETGRNEKTEDGRYPLHIAAQYDCNEIAALLLAHEDVDVNARDTNGNTAAHIAAERINKDTLKVIQSNRNFNGSLVNHLNKTADEMNPLNTLLIKYCKVGKASEVKAMLEDGAKCIQDSTGDTPIHIAYASQIERLDKLSILMDHNKNLINLQSKTGDTIFHKALVDGDRDTMNTILEKAKGSTLDVNLTNQFKKSVVHLCASRNKYLDILQHILAFPNCDVNKEDGCGRNALQLAEAHDNAVAVLYMKAQQNLMKVKFEVS